LASEGARIEEVTMSRRERRAAAARERGSQKAMQVRLDQMHSTCDICVDAKPDQIVMVFANERGRKVVEDLWPEVDWSTDPIFASVHPPGWMFTHVRVTQLHFHFGKEVPLADAAPDALGLAVAMTLQCVAEPDMRVAHFHGEDDEMGVNVYVGTAGSADQRVARALSVEYVPPNDTVAGTA
jgi:hypothetical protein